MKSSVRSDYPHQKGSIDPHSSPACWWWCSRCECAISSLSVQLIRLAFSLFLFFFLFITNPLTSCLLGNADCGRTRAGWWRAVQLGGKTVLLLLVRFSPTFLQGCRMFTSVKAFEGQHYSTLKRQCLQSGLLFEDPRFPAIDDSLFYQGNRIGRVVWKRPRVSCLARFLQIMSMWLVKFWLLQNISLQRTDLKITISIMYTWQRGFWRHHKQLLLFKLNAFFKANQLIYSLTRNKYKKQTNQITFWG